MRDLPAAVRAKAVQAGATAWLDALPSLVAGLAADWGLTPGRAFGDATEAYVVEAGETAVLKIHLWPGAAAEEAVVLRLAGGAGCARLLRADPGRHALLIERLGTPMSGMSIEQPRRQEILCDLASAVWRPVPGVSLPTGADVAARMAQSIERRWAEQGRPCRRAAVDQALRAAESRRRAQRSDRAVLCHGDVHQWNALWSPDGFKLVDPDGAVAEPERDLGALMREDPVELMTGDPRDRARLLAARTGTDPVAVWEWGLADRVATGLVLSAAGVEPVASRMLSAADRIADL
ncbi:aminoglycoside phosphotransferase family protein [Actinoplanes sp. NPDC048988]|uniref:aminoglycoside phosphotransferase family protein n=1 Tax=Actinoplanes sp. NPDC048988 TaxID=3363901 RepID=UPI00370FCFB1